MHTSCPHFPPKKLLLLGGVTDACEIVKQAHQMGGIEVYVTDYLTDSPAKKFADRSFMVSATDVDAVVNLCQQEGIDGVITGYVDSLLPFCEQICRRLHLPFWGNARNIELCIDKIQFKLACEKSGLPVIPWCFVTPDTVGSSREKLTFPVVIKPSDNSGSRGVYKCYDVADFESLCQKAFEYSKEKKLLVERLMDAHSELTAYYLIHHGKAYLTGVGDRFVNASNPAIAPRGQGMFFPSKRTAGWIQKIDPLIQQFLADNQMTEGFVFFQGFEEKGEFFIHEVGYRLNGGHSFKIFDALGQPNQVQELIRFALTGSMDAENLSRVNPLFPQAAFVLTTSLLPGTIAKIEGIEAVEALPGVLGVSQLHQCGETLNHNGTTAQVFSYTLLLADSVPQLVNLIKTIIQTVKITDPEGNNLISPMIEADKLLAY